MVYLVALLIFAAITAAIWFAAVAIHASLFTDPDLRNNPNFPGASAISVFLVTLVSPVPFPLVYVLSLGVWALAVWILELKGARAWTLLLTLAVLSVISRLAVLGVIGF